MQKKIFISRKLKPESLFLKRLSAKGFVVNGQSLLEFSAVPFSDLPSTDWIFFYSQRAVAFFFNKVKPEDLKVQYAAFGAATAKALKQRNINLGFCGTGKGTDTAAAFEEVASGKRVLFPRARYSRKTIQKLLVDKIQAIDLVIYHNAARTNFDIPEMDYLVFTSPKNAITYFEKYSLKKHQRVFAIGPTTANALKKIGIKKVEIAARASEEGLADLIAAF